MYTEIIAALSEFHKSHWNRLRGQSVELLTGKPSGTSLWTSSFKGLILAMLLQKAFGVYFHHTAILILTLDNILLFKYQ
jgi:hypothetical protein